MIQKIFLKTQRSLFVFACAVGTLVALVGCQEDSNSNSDSTDSSTRVSFVEGACSEVITSSEDPSTDPYFEDQWHLFNTGFGGGEASEDVNVSSVWALGNQGQGNCIVIVDDGLDLNHEDLKENLFDGKSYDYSSLGDFSNFSDYGSGEHGTAVAGLIAARGDNGKGTKGIAHQSRIVGYNLIGAGGSNYSTSNENDAMTRNIENIAISNNSWGSTDGLGTLSASNLTWRSGIELGLSTGRGGLGTLYVWAAGNGGVYAREPTTDYPIDNSNYDGQANFYGVVNVCASTNTGEWAYYSEKGANLWVCGPSNGYDSGPYRQNTIGITTTDITGTGGYRYQSSPGGDYYDSFGGTSGAAPMVSGVISLVLKQNPNLTWRDVKLILAKSARQIDPSNDSWAKNSSSGYYFSHKYGFGVVDADAAVNLASSWINLISAETAYETTESSPNTTIPDNTNDISDSITVSGSGVERIEYVDITFSASDHPNWGDLAVTLTSPSGMVSVLAERHRCIDGFGRIQACGGISSWTFGSSAHLNEPADGIWTLKVEDRNLQLAEVVDYGTGTFDSWRLKFYGRKDSSSDSSVMTTSKAKTTSK